VVLRIGLNPTRSTSPCYNNDTFMQTTVIQKIHTFTYIHKNESKHSEMGPVRQNPIHRPVSSVDMCVHCTVQAMGNLRNAKCESAKGYFAKSRAKDACEKWVKRERYPYAKSAFELRCAYMKVMGK